MSNFKFKINNVGSINHADMDIGRINVIGGKNCTTMLAFSQVMTFLALLTLRILSLARKEIWI